MELASLSGFRLKDQILLDQGLNLLLGGYPGDVLSDIDERTVEFELVIKQFGQDELHLGIELADLQTFQVLLLELPNHIGIVGYHGFQEPN